MKKCIKLTIVTLLLFISCKGTKSPEPIADKGLEKDEVTIMDIETLKEPTILNHYVDSIGMGQLIEKYGDDAETILDDLMWYNYEMTNKADSIGLPIKTFRQRNLKLKYGDSIFEHIQDTGSGFVTLFYFDGKTIKESDALEMIELLQKK